METKSQSAERNEKQTSTRFLLLKASSLRKRKIERDKRYTFRARETCGTVKITTNTNIECVFLGNCTIQTRLISRLLLHSTEAEREKHTHKIFTDYRQNHLKYLLSIKMVSAAKIQIQHGKFLISDSNEYNTRNSMRIY